MRTPLVFFSLVLFTLQLSAQLPAFPGAEGAGGFTTGGRGTASVPTTVFEVTNLDDNTSPGSLRYALTQPATYRTVVFRVSGTIHLQSKLTIKGNTTIAGQTAPGDGICIADHPVVISGDNVIVRYIRIRMGDRHQNLGMVDGSGNGDALENLGNKKIIIDHCSISWSADEALTIYRGDSITLQWNIVSEPLNYSYHFESGGTDFQEHAYIGIWGARRASFHHNLLAHAKGRMPRFAGSSTYPPATPGQENADFRNNVVYNWISYSTNGGEGGNYNIVNNYYKYGPSTSTGNSAGVPIRFQIMNPYKSSSLPYPKLYISGNHVDGSTAITQANWKGVSMNGGSLNDTSLSKVTTPFNISVLTTHSATEAYNLVLDYAGAILPKRDTLDERIESNVRNRTGKVIDVQGGYPHGTPYAQTIDAWPALQSATAPADTDKDGMPDAWETANGLNPNDASDRSAIAVTGYTQLENYINSLASDAIILQPGLTAFAQTGTQPSAAQTYVLTAKNLTGKISIKAPEGFEISADATTWFGSDQSLEITPDQGMVEQMNIYIRMNALAPGTLSGVLRHRAYAGGYVDIAVNGTRSAVTALPAVNETLPLFVHPNPAKDFLTINHPSLGKTSIFSVLDLSGRMLFSRKGNRFGGQTTISTAILPAGVYVILLTEGSRTRKAVFVKD